MISSDGIEPNRWVVNPETGELPGEELPGDASLRGVNVRLTTSKTLATEGMEHLKAAACAFDGSLVQAIRQNPYRAVFIAAGAGILAGIVLKRPSSRRS